MTAETRPGHPPTSHPSTSHPSTWRTTLTRRVAATDLVLLLGTNLLTWHWHPHDAGTWAHVAWVAGLALAWWGSLAVVAARDGDVLGGDRAEYVRVLRATFYVFGVLALVAVIDDRVPSGRYVVLTAVCGLAALLLGRFGWRRWLRAQRRRGRCQSLVLAVGSVRAARRIARAFYADPASGYRVTGAFVPDEPDDDDTLLWRTPEDRWPPIPLRGNTHTLLEVLAECGADTVIVTDSEQLGPDGLNALAWQLEQYDVELLLSPNVVGVVQPRVNLRDVSNVPFLHLEKPRYAGANRPLKTLFDKTFALASLLLLSPILIAAAIAVRLSGPGPVLQRSVRVGAHGRPFTMLRFRTMRADADEVEPVVGGAEDAEPSHLVLSAADDERLTRAGALLRRYSIHELPQLFNVLKGDMSVVGPRPLEPHLVSDDELAARRLLVKQGMTGLWQITRNPHATWQDAARLDLEYVENWSMGRDLAIVWRTFTTLVARTAVLRAVDRWQAELELRAPATQARLHVDSQGQLWLNDYPLFSADTPALLEEIEGLLALERPALLVTANVDQVLDLERERKTEEVYQSADLLVIDGMPIVQLARMLGADQTHRHTGADLLPLVAAESGARGWRVSVLGGATGVSDRAAAQLRERYPAADVSSVDFPVLSSLEDPVSLPVIETLHDQRPDIVFVCLGAPKQELWFLQWRDKLPPAVYVGAGAAVDFAAETVRRAPVAVQRIGAEWLWRLAQEPRRLAGRYLVKGPRFIGVILRSLRARSRKGIDR